MRRSLVWLLPCGIAAVYVSVFVAQLPHNIWVIGWDSDFASGFTVPATVVRTGTGGHTVLGTYALYVPLWFGLLTAWLPLHRELWEIAPTMLSVAAALILGWSVAQIANRRAAMLAVLIVLIASPATLILFMSPVAHNTVYVGTALCGAYLVWLARGGARRRATTLAVPPLAAVVLGTCLASDVVLATTGLGPLALTAVLACVRRDRHSRVVGISALTTVLVALPVAKVTSTIMASLGYRTNPPPLTVAPLSTLPAHARLLLTGLEALFGGNVGTAAPGTLHTELGVACDVVMAAALLTLLVAGTRSAIGLLSGRREARQLAPIRLAASLYTVYWASSAAMACGAYLLSEFLESAHEPFYLSVVLSVAAVVPLFVSRRPLARRLVIAGVSIFFTASVVGLTSQSIAPIPPLARYEADVVRLAKADDVTAGYAGYWDASSLTWISRERVKVRPVFQCPNPGGAELCIFSQETVPSWYVPRRRRSFLLVDSTPFAITSLPAGLGRPLATYRFGPIQMYVYPYDIASRLGPPSG